MSGKKNNKYSSEFKQTIVNLYHSGKSYSQIHQEYMSVFSWHTNSPYGSLFNSTIEGSFFLLSVFNGLVHIQKLISESFRNKEAFIHCAVFIEMTANSLDALDDLSIFVESALNEGNIVPDKLRLSC